MTDLLTADDYATPLTPAERDDLIPTYITTRGELNEPNKKTSPPQIAGRLAESITLSATVSLKVCIAACSIASGDGPENSARRNAISASSHSRSRPRWASHRRCALLG